MNEALTRVVLVVAAIVHLTPMLGLLGAPQLQRLYGIAIEQPDLLVLMRHRALLFGLLGLGLLAAVAWPPLRLAMLGAALASTVVYCVLVFSDPTLSAPLRRLAWIDTPVAVALALVLLAQLRVTMTM
jgi:hypothetical protein